MRQELVHRAADFGTTLDRVRGAVEMTLRLGLGESYVSKSFSTKDLSGREYLELLREQQHAEAARRGRADFLQRRVANAVAGVAREEVVSTGRGADETAMLVISHLIDRDHVARYRDAVRDVVRAIGDEASSPERPTTPIPLMISGPWAPYSFAELRRE
jgi:hypothetical protein